MPAPPFFDWDSFDENRVLYDQHDIRQINPQRDAMEQLTAIVHIDREVHGAIGYREITHEEFWTEGHFPGFPLMPGVVLCECAAQLAGFYARKFDLLGGDFLGFGGMDGVRFRYPVRPPCRLILQARMKSIRSQRRAEFEFQGYVERRLVFNGTMIGVPINRSHEMD